jgi:hypothetical protein
LQGAQITVERLLGLAAGGAAHRASRANEEVAA